MAIALIRTSICPRCGPLKKRQKKKKKKKKQKKKKKKKKSEAQEKIKTKHLDQKKVHCRQAHLLVTKSVTRQRRPGGPV